MKKQTATVEQKIVSAKSAMITLKSSGGAVLTLLATLKTDGTALTYATTKDSADAKPVRGMSESFPSMDAAKVHLSGLAEKADKLGWQRGIRVVAAKPDAFSKLPPAPRVA